MPTGGVPHGVAAIICSQPKYARSILGCVLLAPLTGCSLPPARHTLADQPPVTLFARASDLLKGQLDIVAPSGWTASVLPGRAAGADVVVFTRRARVQPARYRVLVIPGSGCTRWSPVAERYFAGLLHAEVMVLHKPYVDVMSEWDAPCTQAFIEMDSLATWRDAAVSAVLAFPFGIGSPLPLVVVGISEGGELLPPVVDALPAVSAVVMVSSSGLDPVVAGALQARRVGHVDAWHGLQWAQESSQSDDLLVQGRTLRYWRALWQWSLTSPLVSAAWPLLRVWGDADQSVPQEAYLQFSAIAVKRQAPFCDIRMRGADHGLQTGQRDGVQWLWSQLERWARQPEINLCDVVRTN